MARQDNDEEERQLRVLIRLYINLACMGLTLAALTFMNS